MDEAETVAANLYNVGNANSLWDFRQIVTGIREAIVQVQSATSTELNRMVDEVSETTVAVHFFMFGAIYAICSSVLKVAFPVVPCISLQ